MRAAPTRLSRHELETFGARHTPGFSLDELADRLGAIGERNQAGFARYGLDESDVAELTRWALEWESDIRLRLAAGEDGRLAGPEEDWDAYLDPPG